jgi:hypothetical protein
MLAPVVHILPLTTLRRERLLPVPGRVTARVDQNVTPLDVVAEAHYGQEHLLIDVARAFGLPAETAQNLVHAQAGETVSKGQVLAQKPGLLPQVLKAPCNGMIMLAGSGRILMEAGEGLYELRAGIPGRVTRQVPERGVEITFNGALVQGVWGNGGLGLGLMLPLLTAPEDVITMKQLDVSLRGSILLAGHCNDAAVLQAAGELPVRGLILGSLAPALVSVAGQLDYPIIVVDGFGLKPMDSAAYNLLTTNVKRDVTLNAQPYALQTGARPEILIPLPVSQEPPLLREVETFAPDQPVRLTRAPHSGKVGMLARLLPGMTALPSGLRVAAAEVRLDTGDQVVVPLANLEVIG